jgi:hypothetical protein
MEQLWTHVVLYRWDLVGVGTSDFGHSRCTVHVSRQYVKLLINRELRVLVFVTHSLIRNSHGAGCMGTTSRGMSSYRITESKVYAASINKASLHGNTMYQEKFCARTK